MDLSGAVVESIGLIGIRCPLLNTLDNKSNKDQNNEEVDEENSFESKKTSESVLSSSVKKLFSSVISSKDAKAVQKAVIAYGHMCFSNFDERWAEEAVDAILGLCRSKVEEILFSVGESLCFIWGSLFVTADEILKTTFVSLSSTSDFLNADVEALHYGMKQHTQSKCDNRGKIKDRIVRKLFDDLLYSSRKEERCAGAVWLVFILMHCGKDPHVHKLLPDIQRTPFKLICAFKNEEETSSAPHKFNDAAEGGILSQTP
ncbi:hypothetical protein KP509_1Z325400 [Ceratopteris richardii]|nr:hypothetical protein KP509_1Z325400 [Ceratopteris richardii]